MNIAIVGCGKQAPKHISGLKKIDDVKLSVCDIDPAAASALAEKEGVGLFNSAEEIFNDPAISAVDICTPTQAHAPLIRQAVSSDKHFICEKPLCDSLDEAKELAGLVNASNSTGMVGFIYRFAPVFEKAAEIFAGAAQTGESPVLGKITSASFRIGGRGSHQVWKHMKKTMGGAMNEMMVHMLDLAHWFFGPAATAQMLEQGLRRPKRMIQGKEYEVDAEDYILARMTTTSGVEVLLQADMLTPAFTQYVEVQGDNGSFMGSIVSSMPSFLFLENAAGGYEKGRTSLEFAPTNMFIAQMAHFVEAARQGGKPSRCSLDDSVTVMQTMEMLRKES